LVSAQVPDDERFIPVCYGLSNVDEFSDRVFILLDEETFEYQIFNTGDCFRETKYRLPNIYSIKSKYFDEEGLAGTEEEVHKYLVRSEVEKQFNKIKFYPWVPKNSPRKEYRKFFRIVHLENTDTINLVDDRLEIINNDDSIQIQDLNKDKKTKETTYVDNKLAKYSIVLFLAIFGLVLIYFVNRKFKK